MKTSASAPPAPPEPPATAPVTDPSHQQQGSSTSPRTRTPPTTLPIPKTGKHSFRVALCMNERILSQLLLLADVMPSSQRKESNVSLDPSVERKSVRRQMEDVPVMAIDYDDYSQVDLINSAYLFSHLTC